MYHLNCNVFYSTKYKVLPHIKLLIELFRSQPHTSVNILTHRTQNSGCFILTQHWAKIHLKNADVKLFACCFSALKQLFAINLIYQLSKILMVLPASFTRAKNMKDLESGHTKKWYSYVLLSFSLISMPYCHLPIFHSSSISKSAPGPASGKVPLISKMASPSLQRKTN